MRKNLMEKVSRKFRKTMVALTRDHAIYPALYPSYWHSRLAPSTSGAPPTDAYFTAIPNAGAGIGHQMANWIAGYWFARRFGLRFAHTPFPSPRWEQFLGFGAGETTAQTLLTERGYRKVRLPVFNEDSPEEVAQTSSIINSYAGKKVLFVAEQDQFYRDHYPVAADLQAKFHSNAQRTTEKLLFSPDRLNIAIHVRRGDIAVREADKTDNLRMRWQGNAYFETVLDQVVSHLKAPYAIWLFSQGQQEQFSEFERFPNLNFCLDMDPLGSFLHMCSADILITSKSSFSYKPALLNKGVKISPQGFWHGYPASGDWVLADEEGRLNLTELEAALTRVNTRQPQDVSSAAAS